MRSRIARAIFCTTFVAVLYLALMPNTGHARFKIVPEPLYRWLEAPWHDDFGNIMAFAVLAAAAFLLGRKPIGRESTAIASAFTRWFAMRNARLVCLLGMVCSIEIVQIWIPGRTAALQDVCTGWSGIFAAWLFAELRDARGEDSARAE